jgi:hypothetical protein
VSADDAGRAADAGQVRAPDAADAGPPRVPWAGDDVPERSPTVYSVVVDGEAVLLDEASERLHHLNASATLVWECLDGHTTVAGLAREISDELGESLDTVLRGTLAIVTDLDGEDLLAPRRPAPPEASPAGPAEPVADDDAGSRSDGGNGAQGDGGGDDSPRWRRRPDALWRRSLDAVIVLPVGADEPLTLAGTGPALWELLAEPCTVAQLAAVLAEAYGAEPEVVEADVAPIVEELVRRQALEPA